MPAANASLITIPNVSAYGPGRQHDLDAGPMQEVGEKLVVVGPCAWSSATPGSLSGPKWWSSTLESRNGLGDARSRVEPLLRPPSPTNATRRRLVADQLLVGRLRPAAEPDHRAVLDDLDPGSVELVDAQEVVAALWLANTQWSTASMRRATVARNSFNS
jgi:hypothetical protein